MATISVTKPGSDLDSCRETKGVKGASIVDRDVEHHWVALWIVRALIVAIAGAFLWYTWGHWGNFQIDNGRELYVPAEILKGKLLFRDLWYMYGPLAAYVNAFLFWIFGVHLTVLYVFGFVLTIVSALLTFEIARRFKLGMVGSMVPVLFFLVEAFYPFIRNFIFPYSYAAALGAVLGLACLYFVVSHAAGMRTSDLAAAAVMCGLVILTKQEIGFACLAMLSVEVVASCLVRRSVSELLGDVAVCFAGLLPAVAGYGWFVWKLSARTIFFDNWISTPGTYFMRTFSKITLPDQGFRFVPAELLQAVEYTVLGVALWVLMASAMVAVIKRLNLKSGLSIAVTTVVCTSPLWLAAIAFVRMFPFGYTIEPSRLAIILVIPLTHAIFPLGIFFLVVWFALDALRRFIRAPRDGLVLQDLGLGIYASLDSMRQMMELRPSIYKSAVFFNVPAFLVFIIILDRIIHWVSRTLDDRRQGFVTRGLLTSEACLLLLLFFPKPQLLTTRLSTDYGSFYTNADVAVIFPRIISFMKTHTRNGRDILVLPEPPSLYVFAGMDAPSRMYSLVPGYVAPDQEQDYINDLISNQVRYVLISNRTMDEYHVRGFGQGGYNPLIYNWIMANYVKVDQFGPLSDAPWPPYVMRVYEKKELLAGN
jgi:hypothetical protein